MLEQLRALVIEGRVPDAYALTEEALSAGVDIHSLVNEALIPAMVEVGERYERMEFYLPEMMAAALAMQSCMRLLQPLLSETEAKPLATVVVGTVKGDLHDIGKDLVGMMLEGNGFEVVNLGVDVAPDKFVEAVRTHDATIMGMSALLTTTMPMMRATIETLIEAGLRDRVKVLVGGAAITAAYAKEIGADAYAPDASIAARTAKSLLASGPLE